MSKYSKEFKITVGGHMNSFLAEILRMQVEQGSTNIELDPDHQVQEIPDALVAPPGPRPRESARSPLRGAWSVPS
jgi:hypothetical protein